MIGGLLAAALVFTIIGTFGYLMQRGALETALKDAAEKPLGELAIEDKSADAEHRYGDPKAKVLVTVFGDYQCPYTTQGVNYLKAVVMQYNNGVALIYHHFPLESIHDNARYAAAATEAASLQGKFWPMSSLIFAEQSIWSDQNSEAIKSTFESYAKTLELNLDKYKKDVDSAATNSKIDKDLAWAKKLDLNGTPSVFINGEQVDIETVYDAAAFNKLISAKL
jgi:protein-disulfide isomerase